MSLGLFKRSDLPARPRTPHEEVDARVAECKRQNELLARATDRLSTDEARTAAAAELCQLIGEIPAQRMIGARRRLLSRGWAIGLVALALVALACAAGSKTPAQVPDGTGTAVPANQPAAQPVNLSGHGEGVVQANLGKAGYTLAYTSSGGFLIVAPVNSDGTDGDSWVNGGSADGSALSGTTVVHATGPTAIHVSNVDGSDWTLKFTPLG